MQDSMPVTFSPHTAIETAHHNQVVFKKGSSVTDALLLLDHLVAESLSAKKHISLISLDFSKAFDKIGVHSTI